MPTYLYLCGSNPMPRKKETRRGKYPRHPHSSISSDNAHPELLEIQSRIAVTADDSEQRELIASAVRLLYLFEPREKQVDCIQWLLYQKQDLVLVAKTSFGKSLVWQILPCLVPRTVIIAILPLLARGWNSHRGTSQVDPKVFSSRCSSEAYVTPRTSARVCYTISEGAIILMY
jgi:hypothetical protein